jgi:protein O-mannosyl-transferase
MRMDTFKESIFHQRYRIIAVFLLILATVAVYSQVKDFAFITFDDDVYVYSEPHVKEGLTIQNIVWCIRNSHAFNWHPLTSISLFMNASVFGLSPASYHLVNVAFHIFNTLLLLLIFAKMTGKFWQSLFVASLFALHPQHVESVAWVSERKDVLSAFFWFLTMLCYWWYAVSPRLTRYIFVALSLILGLLAKPMLVTLPFILLLMDYWPLGRLNPGITKKAVYSLLAEKVPLLFIVAIFSVVTFFVQKSTGMVKSMMHHPLDIRIANVFVQYVAYLKDMVWPFHLSIFYPYPQKIMPVETALAVIMVLAFTLAAVWFVKKLPYLAVGWFWYLGTLIPVIGIIQVGAQARADRYTYLPLIGIFIIISWGMSDLFARFSHKRTLLSISGALVIIGCMVTTWFQVGYWKDSSTLYAHALKVTDDNYWAHSMLGGVFAGDGHFDEAIDEYHQALTITPNHIPTYINLGALYMKRGEYDKAIREFQTALTIDSNYAEAHANLGAAYSALNNPDESIRHFTEALRIKPDLITVHYSLVDELLKKNRLAEAAMHLQEVLKIRPSSAPVRINLGITLSRMNRLDEAARQFSMAAQSNPGLMQASMMYNTTTRKILGITSEIQTLEAAAGKNSVDPGLLYKLATLNSWIGEYAKSERYLMRIIEIQPDNPNGYYNLACIYAKQNRAEEAVRYLQEAVNRGFKDWKMIGEDPDLFNIRDNPYVKDLLKNS